MWNNYQYWIINMVLVKVSPPNRDKYGVKLKFPERTCKQCKKYPCFPEINMGVCNYAAYGCFDYNDCSSKTSSKRR